MADSEETEQRVNNAISQAFTESGEMAVKWLVIAETMDTDGTRGVWTCGSEGISEWDALGLLQLAVHREQAETIRRTMQGEDD